MTRARRILLFGGIALAIVGMCHGTWYAVFAEHQALDQIGGSLASAFTQIEIRHRRRLVSPNTAQVSTYTTARSTPTATGSA